MAYITNRGQAPLQTPDGIFIEPGHGAEIDDTHLSHPVVKAWLDLGALGKGSAPPKKADEPAPTASSSRTVTAEATNSRAKPN